MAITNGGEEEDAADDWSNLIVKSPTLQFAIKSFLCTNKTRIVHNLHNSQFHKISEGDEGVDSIREWRDDVVKILWLCSCLGTTWSSLRTRLSFVWDDVCCLIICWCTLYDHHYDDDHYEHLHLLEENTNIYVRRKMRVGNEWVRFAFGLVYWRWWSTVLFLCVSMYV